MWPWEHAAVGYLTVSLFYRLWARPAPGDGASAPGGVVARPTDAVAVATLVGTQVPDLVDKPLAWWVGVLPSGHSLAHSLPVAFALGGVAVAVTRRLGRPAVGAGFVVGYLTHLLGDVVYPALLGGDIAVGFLVAPLAGVGTVSGTPPGLLATVAVFWSQFTAFLATPRGLGYLLGEVVLLSAAVLAWWMDGRPGLAAVRPTARAGPD